MKEVDQVNLSPLRLLMVWRHIYSFSSYRIGNNGRGELAPCILSMHQSWAEPWPEIRSVTSIVYKAKGLSITAHAIGIAVVHGSHHRTNHGMKPRVFNIDKADWPTMLKDLTDNAIPAATEGAESDHGLMAQLEKESDDQFTQDVEQAVAAPWPEDEGL